MIRYACLSCVPPEGYAHLVFEDVQKVAEHLKRYPLHFIVEETKRPVTTLAGSPSPLTDTDIRELIAHVGRIKDALDEVERET